MSYREDQQYIFGCLLLLSNKLQLLGDKITGALTLKQWFLLNMIHNMKQKSPNIIEIARVIGTSRQNVSKMIAILEKKGMVKLDCSKMDHRAVNVTLTQKCFDYFASNESAGSKLLDTLFSDMPQVETEQVAALLGHILEKTEAALAEETKP